MARAAIYMRVSSVGQEENYSLPGQEEDCRTFASQNGHDVVLVFNDGAQKSFTLDRPGLIDMLQAAKQGMFDILIVGKYDRLSRVLIQQQVIVYQLQRSGQTVVSVKEPLPDGPTGDLLRSTYAFAAEVELLSIRQRTTSGRKRRVRAGKLLVGAHPLYGYVWANADQKHGKDYYLIDPETAPIVQSIFEMVLSGRTLRSIAAELELGGVPTPGQILLKRGQLPKKRTVSSVWRLSTLNRILSNPAYIGKHVGWRRTLEEIKKRDPASGEIVTVKRIRMLEDDDPDRFAYEEHVCPPIVDEATFLAVQTVLARNKANAARRLADPEAALLRNGFAVCGFCGRTMTAKFHKGNNHYRYWCAATQDVQSIRCPAGQWSVKTDDLDRIVWEWIVEAFKRPEIIRHAFEEWKANQASGRSFEFEQLQGINDALEAAQGRWRNCVNSAAEAKDEATRAYFTKLADDAGSNVKGLQKEYNTLAEALAKIDVQVEQIESLITLGSQAVSQLLQADWRDKRTFLYALGVVVKVRNLSDYKIGWKLDHIGDEAVSKQLSVPNFW
jgi:DNA invertase Pin-like site-specific DNA recombinase